MRFVYATTYICTRNRIMKCIQVAIALHTFAPFVVDIPKCLLGSNFICCFVLLIVGVPRCESRVHRDCTPLEMCMRVKYVSFHFIGACDSSAGGLAAG
ncbi:hypothetical protein EVAR_50194_1 [Eumeta japonica]|uniref:Uncharacterized protein n=1 Tax=Eumeta variegata TaxID=151549 RepID=A0A4C1X0B8_EUMVA|nr:hypothetical protein EVAR_50194_1 [Eumeta japonica]